MMFKMVKMLNDYVFCIFRNVLSNLDITVKILLNIYCNSLYSYSYYLL